MLSDFTTSIQPSNEFHLSSDGPTHAGRDEALEVKSSSTGDSAVIAFCP